MKNIKLISKKEASKILFVSVRTIERMISNGDLAKIKLRGLVRLQYADVMKLAEEGC